MSDQALITRDNASLAIAFTAQAELQKEVALSSAALIGRVTNAQENELAASAQSKLADLRRAVEKARVEAKKPFLDAGKEIDRQAAVFVFEISAEELRITTLAGDFHALEAAKRQAEEKRIRLEQEAIERAAREEQQRILREQIEREATLRKQEAETARLAREATNARQRAEAERQRIELERQRELSQAKTHEQLDAAQEKASEAQAAVQTAAPVPIRATGQRVKADLEITITDIWALARAHPGLVNIEPRIGDIKAAIQGGAKIAGVTSKEKFNVQATTRRQPAAIEV